LSRTIQAAATEDIENDKAFRIRQNLWFAGSDPPVECGVHPEVPDRHRPRARI